MTYQAVQKYYGLSIIGIAVLLTIIYNKLPRKKQKDEFELDGGLINGSFVFLYNDNMYIISLCYWINNLYCSVSKTKKKTN